MGWLSDNGFVQDGNKFTKTIQVTRGQINGQPIVNNVRLTIERIGEGFISDIDNTNQVALYGYRLNDVEDFWVDKEEGLGAFLNEMGIH